MNLLDYEVRKSEVKVMAIRNMEKKCGEQISCTVCRQHETELDE